MTRDPRPLADHPYTSFRRLVRVQTALWNAVDADLRQRHGVPLTHAMTLQVVRDTDDCRVQDLVATLHITVGGASKAVDRLVAAGHARRVAHPGDGRSSMIRVTPAGTALLAAVAPDVERVLAERLVGPLGADPHALDALDAALERLDTREGVR